MLPSKGGTMDKTFQLVDEVKQITEQYKKEVSTKRRAWPKSIKDRIFEIRNQGHSCRSISKMTGIPEPTVWLWISKQKEAQAVETEPGFMPVQVNSTVKSLTVKARTKTLTVTEDKSFKVELPGGIKIEGVDLDAIVELSRRLAQ